LTSNLGAPKFPPIEHRFSIVTPTYNRPHLLPALYESLRAQTFRDFEWVVVDDGSRDETRDLVLSWKPDFPLRYYWQPNGGMHRALNLGLRTAQGEFYFQLDDDDRLLPHALARFDREIAELPEVHAFINSLCCRPDGTILGSPLPDDRLDTFRLRDALALADADRCGIVRTGIMRGHLFPEFPGEKYIIPGVVWNRMHQRYACRWINEPLKIVGYAPGHMSSQDLRHNNPRGAMLYYRELAVADVPAAMRIKGALNYARFAAVLCRRKLGGLNRDRE
jgi:glycosyltransferase involved in cell wall biosynthesis